MRVLVTGGAGFIGSHLVERLLDRGDEVWALDDLSTGRLENLSGCIDHPRFHFVRGSVTDRECVSRLAQGVERIFHVAAAVGVRKIMEEPLRSLMTNLTGTEVVLEAAAGRGLRTLIFSSSEVYGKGARVPFHEDDDLVLGSTGVLRWSYACGKAADEFMAIAYSHERGLPVTVVRCFNTCGPRQTDAYGMVVPTFLTRALRGDPIPVHGDGSQTRCFSYVGDVVHGVLLLADSAATTGQVYNIGNDEEVSILGLAQRILQLVDSRSRIVYVPYREVYGPHFEDMARRVPSLEKIRAAVGYRPEVSLEQLLEITLAAVRAGQITPILA
ncbi:MAG TPA: GDP-mannose 4,6-dehydratase [Candidatus Saccharimonadales bacterium]|nr:GDP-mannose 4,6-dehydratase [Candidatus Saccharimonadales bacterium]